MVHRTKMDAIDVSLPARDDRRRGAGEHPYPRCRSGAAIRENIVGVLHAKDAAARIARRTAATLGTVDIMALSPPPWFVPDTTTAQGPAQRLPEAQGAFRPRGRRVWRAAWASSPWRTSSRRSSATSTTSTTSPPSPPRSEPDGSLIVDGTVPIRDLNRMMDWDLPDDEADHHRRPRHPRGPAIPEPGQLFTFHGFRFEVLRRQRNQITSLRVTPLATDATGPARGGVRP